jgi:hypothetical protein
MARVARSIPAALSCLVLGAHFLRAGTLVAAAVCVIAAALAFSRDRRIVVALRIGLAAGSALWILTAWRIARLRIGEGAPYVRMLVILGVVAVFTALSAWWLPAAPPRRPADHGRS